MDRENGENGDNFDDFDEKIKRLNKDLREAAETLSRDEARFLVDAYYIMQENRIREDSQIRTLQQNAEPSAVIGWLSGQTTVLEDQIKAALDRYSSHQPIGIWARSIKGIGPVIAAGLIAHVDIHECETASQVWRFAGLDPTHKWINKEKAGELVRLAIEVYPNSEDKTVSPEALACIAAKLNMSLPRFTERMRNYKTKKLDLTREGVTSGVAKRPWNAGFKTLCWKLGQSFMKFSNATGESNIYGPIYRQRKAYEIERNDRGDNKELAAQILASKRFNRSTDAYGHYKAGHLPPGQIDARARRYAVKQFLSHFHEKWRRLENLPVREPYAIAILGHAHNTSPSHNHSDTQTSRSDDQDIGDNLST
jgi:hypothetical protein